MQAKDANQIHCLKLDVDRIGFSFRGKTEFQYEPNQVWSQYEYEWQVKILPKWLLLVKIIMRLKTVSFDFPSMGT